MYPVEGAFETRSELWPLWVKEKVRSKLAYGKNAVKFWGNGEGKAVLIRPDTTIIQAVKAEGGVVGWGGMRERFNGDGGGIIQMYLQKNKHTYK